MKTESSFVYISANRRAASSEISSSTFTAVNGSSEDGRMSSLPSNSEFGSGVERKVDAGEESRDDPAGDSCGVVGERLCGVLSDCV